MYYRHFQRSTLRHRHHDLLQHAIQTREQLEKQVLRKLDSSTDGSVNDKEGAAREIDATRREYIGILDSLEQKINLKFSLNDISQTSGKILSCEQQDFARLRQENFAILTENLATQQKKIDAVLNHISKAVSLDSPEGASVDAESALSAEGEPAQKRIRKASSDFSSQSTDQLRDNFMLVANEYTNLQEQASTKSGDKLIHWQAEQKERERREIEEFKKSVSESKRTEKAEEQKRVEDEKRKHGQGSSSNP